MSAGVLITVSMSFVNIPIIIVRTIANKIEHHAQFAI